jgi:type II secretory pathway component GspD/PulD (secretin)
MFRRPLVMGAALLLIVAATTLLAEPKKLPENTVVYQVYYLHYTQPSDVQAILCVIPSIQCWSDDPHGRLIVKGKVSDLHAVDDDITKQIDKAPGGVLGQRSTFVFKVPNGSARVVASQLLAAQTFQTPYPLLVPDDTDKQIQFYGTLEQRQQITRNLIKIDHASPAAAATTYQITNAAPLPVASGAAVSSTAQGMVASVLAALNPLYNQRLAMVVDQNTNTVAISGDPQAILAAHDMLVSLDQPPLTIELDMAIYQITLNDAQNIGLTVPNNEVGVSLGEYFPGPIALSTSSPPPAFSLPGKIVRMPISVAAQFNTMLTNGTGYAESFPQLRTLSGKTATLHVGDQIAVSTFSAPVSGFALPGASASISTGLVLSVTPFATTPNAPITLSIDASLSDLTGFTPQGTPDVATRETTSTIRVSPEEVIVISGQRGRQYSDGKGHIYPFEKIGFLKNIFGNKQLQQVDSQAYVVIIPHILSDHPDKNINQLLPLLNEIFKPIPVGSPTPISHGGKPDVKDTGFNPSQPAKAQPAPTVTPGAVPTLAPLRIPQ